MSLLLDIIIVNWNTGDQLRECLETIVNSSDHTDFLNRVVVVDNASSDGSADYLSAIELPLTVIRNSFNRGFSAACNQGANGSSADIILFLNPDTRLLADSLITPLSLLSQPEHQYTGIIGIQLVDDSGKISRSCARFPTLSLFIYKTTGLNRAFPNTILLSTMIEWDHRQTRSVDQVIGAFFMVRAQVYWELCGFDEQFFVYYEEVDFALRAKQKGWQTCYLSGVQAYHKGGGATDAVKDIRLFYLLRSQIIYGCKHMGFIKAIILIFFILMIEPWTRLAAAVMDRSFSQIIWTLKAYGMLWQDLPHWSKLCMRLLNLSASFKNRQVRDVL